MTPLLILLAALLALAVVSLWLPPLPAIASSRRVPAWAAGLGAALAVAVAAGAVTMTGIAVVLLLIALCAAHARSTSTWLRVLLFAAIFVVALAMALHKAPGFHNPLLVTDIRASALAKPVTQYLNIDKATAGIILLAFFAAPARSRAEWRAALRMWPVMIVTPIVVLGCALLAGVVVWDLKLPAHTPLFLLSNLLVTCVAEEAFFRGFLQGSLLKGMAGKRYGVAVAIGVASILFGIAHLGGGTPMIVLATLAGIGYGIAAWRSGRIEAAILTHFTVNALRFVLVTGPVLVRTAA